MSSLFSEDAKSEQSQTERNRNEQKRERSAMHLSPEKAGFSVSTSQSIRNTQAELNSRPPACWAGVMTTRPYKLREEHSKICFRVVFDLFLRFLPSKHETSGAVELSTLFFRGGGNAPIKIHRNINDVLLLFASHKPWGAHFCPSNIAKE